MIPDDTRPSSQRRPPPAPPPIGSGHKPGAAADGTVLQCIETAVEKHVKAKPSMDLESMLDLVKDFAVVRADGRPICLLYLDKCIRHFQRVADDESTSGRSTVASRENAEDRSTILSGKSVHTTPLTSTEREQPSALALDDVENNIEILLPNDASKAVRSLLRNGEKSYISPRILKRCSLHADSITAKVLIDLRWTIVDENRGRSYRVLDCSFRVRDDLEPDLAIGSKVQERLKKRAGFSEDSWNPNESTDDKAFGNGSRRSISRAISRDVKTSSHAGSSTRSSVEPSNSKTFLKTYNRALDLDLSERNEDSAYSNRRSDRDDLHTMSPERKSRSRRRPR